MKRSGVFKWSLIITIFSVIRFLTTYGIQYILAAKYGAGNELDAYWASSSIPNLVATVSSNSIQITLIPVFVEYINSYRETEGWKVISWLLNILLIILTVLFIFSLIFSRAIVQRLTPGFVDNPEQFNLIIDLFRIGLPSIYLTTIMSLLIGIYNAQQRFLLSGIAPAVSTIINLMFVMIFNKNFGIRSVPIGAVIGSFISILILLPVLGHGRYSFSLNFHHPSVRKVIKLASIWIAFSLVSKANPVVDSIVGSLLPEGSISYIGFGLKIATLIVTIFSAGISTVLFPIVSKFANDGSNGKLSNFLSNYLRFNFIHFTSVIRTNDSFTRAVSGDLT